MRETTITVTNPTGLHSRPANQLVLIAKKYQCDIKITKDDKTINAKSMLSIMKAGIVKDSLITIACDGADEDEALKALSEFVVNLAE